MVISDILWYLSPSRDGLWEKGMATLKVYPLTICEYMMMISVTENRFSFTCWQIYNTDWVCSSCYSTNLLKDCSLASISPSYDKNTKLGASEVLPRAAMSSMSAPVIYINIRLRASWVVSSTHQKQYANQPCLLLQNDVPPQAGDIILAAQRVIEMVVQGSGDGRLAQSGCWWTWESAWLKLEATPCE